MGWAMVEAAKAAFLAGTTRDFFDPSGVDLMDRWLRHADWWDERLDRGVDPYSKFTDGLIQPEQTAYLRDGREVTGVNLASQDYLGLSAHPAVLEAAKKAIDEFGVHSAGSAALMGNTRLSRLLEERLATFTGFAECTVFPTGWGAGYSAIKTLVQPSDHVVIDVLAHNCLREGASGATRNVHSFPHLSNEGVERRLARIRRGAPDAGILVVTETVFSMDSDVPNLHELKDICRRYRATLMVDVAHDFGAIGAEGRGYLDIQQACDIPDILMGSFSKTFASNGGFVASNNPALKLALRYNSGPLTFTNALSPVQAATILKALEIVSSDEGRERRERLMRNAVSLREKLVGEGFRVMGEASAVVPVILGGNALSRLATKYAIENGAIVNLVEYPAVAKNVCRWRLQLSCEHTEEQLERFVAIAIAARGAAEAAVRSSADHQDEGVRLVAEEVGPSEDVMAEMMVA